MLTNYMFEHEFMAFPLALCGVIARAYPAGNAVIYAMPFGILCNTGVIIIWMHPQPEG